MHAWAKLKEREIIRGVVVNYQMFVQYTLELSTVRRFITIGNIQTKLARSKTCWINVLEKFQRLY